MLGPFEWQSCVPHNDSLFWALPSREQAGILRKAGGGGGNIPETRMIASPARKGRYCALGDRHAQEFLTQVSGEQRQNGEARLHKDITLKAQPLDGIRCHHLRLTLGYRSVFTRKIGVNVF